MKLYLPSHCTPASSEWSQLCMPMFSGGKQSSSVFSVLPLMQARLSRNIGTLELAPPKNADLKGIASIRKVGILMNNYYDG